MDYSLKKLLKSPFPVTSLPYLLLIFAGLGLLDAIYLTIQHFLNKIPPCTVGGCETVLTSNFATVFGIPISLIGAGFYLMVIVLTGMFLTMHLKPYAISIFIFILCSFGLLVGLALIGIQAFVLHAWCYYCLFSELIDFLLFDASWWLWESKS